MTRAEIARQVAYYQKLHFARRRILYELKRRLGAKYSRRVIAFVDQVIEGNQPTLPDAAAKRRAALVERLVEKFTLKKRGKQWLNVERSADLDHLKTRSKAIVASLRRFGFGAEVIRGDVGQWSEQLKYTRARGLELYASVTLYERRRPYRLELALCSGG